MKRAAGAESALGPDAPAVRFHDAPRDVQAETHRATLLYCALSGIPAERYTLSTSREVIAVTVAEIASYAMIGLPTLLCVAGAMFLAAIADKPITSVQVR
jgi:hypothetical protein